MIKKNDIVELNITGITNEGMGVAHTESGLTVFVPFTAVGDIIKALIVKVKSSYAYGKCMEIITPSLDRVATDCTAYKKCGGCQLMHMNYAAQIKAKQKFIYDSLTRIGGQNISLEQIEMITAENQTGYRNKMVYPVGVVDGKAVCGFYAQRSHNVIPLNGCMLGMGEDNKIIEALLKYMSICGVQPYDEENHKGSIRRVFIRRGRFSGETMVVVSSKTKKLPDAQMLSEFIKNADKSVVSIIHNINPDKTNLVLGAENKLIYGKWSIHDTLCGVEYEISPHSFFQVNPYQTEKLYNKAIEYADLNKSQTVLDIYCGIGTISLSCAGKVNQVIGVEIVEKAIEDACKNAKSNGITNVEFYAGQAEKVVPDLISKGVKPDVVILDPPRKGSDEITLKTIIGANPQRIVYVSCNPSTLARDIKVLNEGGYTLQKISGVDMFPNTVHVECCVLLCRT